MQAQLDAIPALPQRDRTAAYLALLPTILATPTTLLSHLALFLDAIVADSTGQVIARQVLSDYVDKITGPLVAADRELSKAVMKMSLDKIQPRAVTFEDEICTLREKYADILEEDEEFPEAAKVLIGISLESGQRAVQMEYKLKIYVRIVRLFLEEQDSTSAETYFNRANLIYHHTSDPVTQLHFKLAQARMFDYSRRFAESASKYHEISYDVQVDESERLAILSAAITCAVLAPAGPTRSRILSSLFRDERSATTPHHTILSKMFLDQIIRAAEVSEFASTLQPHQLARLPPTTSIVAPDDEDDEVIPGGGDKLKTGPENVLDRAMMEHNLLSASRIYTHITFRGLGLLLSLTPSAAEGMARTMIQQGRLKGQLDQVASLLSFEPEDKDAEGAVAAVAVAAGEDEMEPEELASAPETKKWDQQIRGTLQKIESIAVRCEMLLAGQTIPPVEGEGEVEGKMKGIEHQEKRGDDQVMAV